ncbi:MAG: DUF2075 domain-containing protein [Paludibacteraceae bacterium]|nr:DUF2075 domain-containing protein [Paludibacteraceae bacterium]
MGGEKCGLRFNQFISCGMMAFLLSSVISTFRYQFRGSKWMNINKEEIRRYQINAYRVILTRARRGMVIYVPVGNNEDHTRKSEFYNSTYNYFKQIGIKEI